MQFPNPWGLSNTELLTLYKGATADNECPMMVEKDLPSCGKSRFGCWMCTIVSEDKSMQAMITNDAEKQWLSPLLRFRNEIGQEDSDFSRRSFRKMRGNLQGDDKRLYHGPYTKETREKWLKSLLELQLEIQRLAPDEYAKTELITIEELREIRRIWVNEKHEFDDSLPRIYKEVFGTEFPDPTWINNTGMSEVEWELLAQTCQEVAPDEELMLELVSSLLCIESVSSSTNMRGKIYEKLEAQIKRCFYKNEEDATNVYLARRARTNDVLGIEEKDEYEIDDMEEVE